MSDSVMSTNDIDSLSKEIECIMCLHNAADCRMCTHCSAMACTRCIEGWIDSRQSCPQCSRSVQQTDFIKCHLADKLNEFLDTAKLNSCTKHGQETPRVYCSTCSKYVCFECIAVDGQHTAHDYRYIDEDYKQLITVNHELLEFMRKRLQDNREHLEETERSIQALFTNHSSTIERVDRDERTTNVLIAETQQSFDELEEKKRGYVHAIETDESIVIDVERRLKESRSLLDQEEILQVLQRNITTKFESRTTQR